MKTTFIEKSLEDTVRYLSSIDILDKQIQEVRKAKRSQSLSKIGGGILSIVIAVGVLGLALSNNFALGMALAGVLFLFFVGSYFLFSGVTELAKARPVALPTDIDELCRAFYTATFLQGTYRKAKIDQIMDVWHLIPAPIWQNYTKPGWSILIGKSNPNSTAQPITCILCNKKFEDSKKHLGGIPQSGKVLSKQDEPQEIQKFIQNGFLKCEYCGWVVCYECSGYEVSDTEHFLCLNCGKATNGQIGLVNRWLDLRRRLKKDMDPNIFLSDFSLSAISVDKTPRVDQRIFDVVIHLSGTPFGEIAFYNVALCFHGKWFLASPEPILA